MIRRIKLLDRVVEYDLQRKRVKNINLRIKPDKTITVSANQRVSESRIEDFLKEKEVYILKALVHYEELERIMQKPRQFIDGEIVKVFDKELKLKVFLAKKNCVEIDEPFIKLYVRSIDDVSLKKKVLEKWLRKQVEETIIGLCKSIYPMFKKYCGDFPTVRFRKMVSRWGSCHCVRKILTFNYALVNVPITCVEYVVYHEFTHFIQANHSAKFYKALSIYLPDYKERKKELQKIFITWL